MPVATAATTRTHLAEDIFPGHPDRIADAVAELIVDEAVRQDPDALVGVEVAVHRRSVFVTGRVAALPPSEGYGVKLDLDAIAARAFATAGYTGAWEVGPSVAADLDLGPLADDERGIRRYSDDQNIVVGHAEGTEATAWLPAAPFAVRRLRERLVALRGEAPGRLGPDGKVLIRIDERDGRYAWGRINVSLHHAPGAGGYEELYALLLPALAAESEALDAALPGLSESFDAELVHLNGAGDFSCGGTFGDNGLSGKKLVVDGYGPGVPIGGGALCGKDPHKVDRVGAVAARQLAVRLVRDAGAGSATVLLGWLPGQERPEPIVARVDGEEWDDARVRRAIAVPDLSIESIFQRFELASERWVDRMRDGYFGSGAAWER